MLERIHNFLKDYFLSENFFLKPITNSASDRNYYRVNFNESSYILTFSYNIPETKCFLYFSKIFKENNIHVPSIIYVDTTYQLYLQEDVGNTDLLSLLNIHGEDQIIGNLYRKSLDELIKIQFHNLDKIDFSNCYDFSEFEYALIYNDLNYFKFSFFQPLEIPFSNKRLLQEFSDIAKTVSSLSPQGFMYRDFQSRNIMINKSQPFFIDYQGGVKGNTVYDLVSILWQAKAQLSTTFKNQLKDYYFQQVQKEIQITKSELDNAYQYCLLIRLLQVLGAYGFRGILQKKPHFASSIFYGIENIKTFIHETFIMEQYPELLYICSELFKEDTKNKIKNVLK